ncbi:MAG: bifunctional UDP-3-O-[3-hydroxymyristoyl] N-acetylglucosamine deacetylase/3-hydroxyacyl-ACP dehydratase [Bacteroidales bacterium]|nr:bifunctional UDP-3-O-[3-hydroxymyristoyl] N-acetylglucosamine deacetylase/3-hydroxyacyl-ACP dehydratase [Bacteroidales bacterium]
MADKQRTIAKPVTVKGKGLHTGLLVELTFYPAEENHGIKFKRIDMENKPIIEALADHVVETSRGTTLEQNGARIGTIEHVMAAIHGLRLDNLMLEVTGPEVPILDGSSYPVIEALSNAGIKEQQANKEYYEITEKKVFVCEKTGSEIIAYPDDNFSIDVLIDFNSKVVGHQYATLKHLDDFKDEIAMSKTFVFMHELEILLKNNLIKGGDLDNALVIMDRHMEQDELNHLAELFNKPKIKVQPEGVLNNTVLHYQNEPARHKLLDMVGDLALIGMPIKGKFVATRPGHSANTAFAKMIRAEIKATSKKVKAPKYDPNEEPLLEINQIMKILPHRPPFLLIDRVIKRDEEQVIGIKNVSMNEGYFVGHFPDEPVMPGVLQIEAMAQMGGILVLNTVPDPENYATYFLKIDKVKFKKKVVPGDTIIIRMTLIEPIRRGIAHMFGEAFVGDTLVTEGELMAQIVKVRGLEKN